MTESRQQEVESPTTDTRPRCAECGKVFSNTSVYMISRGEKICRDVQACVRRARFSHLCGCMGGAR